MFLTLGISCKKLKKFYIINPLKKNTYAVFTQTLLTSELEQFISDAWNNPIARVFVPDKIGFSGSSTCVPIVGFGCDFSFNWMMQEKHIEEQKNKPVGLLPFRLFWD